MTKEEFLTMINTELENLEIEFQKANNRANHFRQIDSNIGYSYKSQEQKEANYQLHLISQRLGAIKVLVNLPAYARIQAMSNVEIEAYKKEKIDELSLKIEELKAKESQERAKVHQLKAQQEELLSQYGSLSGTEKDNAIYREQKLQIELTKYDSNNQHNVFGKIQKEVQEIYKMQEQIQNKTSQEIKNELSAEIKGSTTLTSILEYNSKYGLESSRELLASVAEEPEKAQQMANLLTYYNRVQDEAKEIKVGLYFEGGLPSELSRRLKENRDYYDSNTNTLHEPDKLTEIVIEFEETFNQAKNDFMNNFTLKKLSKLLGKEQGVFSSQVDMNFLQQHKDKLNNGTLEHLQSLVAQRDKLSKKIIKTKNVKQNIKSLNSRIEQEQNNIYKRIIGWYKSQSRDILGLSNSVSFWNPNPESLQRDLERLTRDIDDSQRAISEMKENIQKAKVELKCQVQKNKDKKTAVEQQIRTLAGPKFMETDIPYTSNKIEHNLNSIVDAASKTHQVEVINRVQQEAQNQADTKEAEIRKMSVEQLLEMRNQAILEQSLTQTNDEELSHRMKR